MTQHEEIDITEMEQFRSSLYDYYLESYKVTPLALHRKLSLVLFKRISKFTASIDPNQNKASVQKIFILAFAVDTPHGLMVPKIRQVDK